MSIEFRQEPIRILKPIKSEARHIFLFGEVYRFIPGSLDFGNTVQIILPPHGDFGCDCGGCRVFRAISKVERQFNVRLGGSESSKYSEEMQAVAHNAAGIIPISLSGINTSKPSKI